MKEGKASPSTDGRKFLAGTVADRVMREWLQNGDPQPGQMVDMVEDVYRRYTKPTFQEKAEHGQDIKPIKWRGNPADDRDAIRNFVVEVVTDLEPVLLQHVIPYRYEPEMSFEVPIVLDNERFYMVGRIDIVVQDDDDQFHAYDLKATKDPSYIDKVLGQSVFYDIALGNFFGDRTQPKSFGFIFPACPEKVRWVFITDTERAQMLQRIGMMVRSVRRKEFEPKKDDADCNWCEVKHACDKFMLDIQSAADGSNRVSWEQAAATRTKTK